MGEAHVVAAPLEVGGGGIGDRDAPVLTTCAADGDGEVALALRHVSRHGDVEQVVPGVEELLRHGIAEDEVAHELVVAGERAHLRVIEGVGQETDVDHEVRLDGHAVLEAKGEDGHLHELLVRQFREGAAQADAQVTHL